jgi:hypothetical protein
MLSTLTLLRAILIGQMLADLLHSNSYHFATFTAGITPGVPTWGRGLALAAFMVAALLQPVVTTGLNAALSLFLSAWIRHTLLLRTALGLLTLAELIGFTLAVTAGIVVLDLDPVFHHTYLSMPERWLALLSLALLGDQSLRFMNLRSFTQTWAQLDYGIGLAVAIPLAVLLESLFTLWLVRRAARRAMRASRE